MLSVTDFEAQLVSRRLLYFAYPEELKTPTPHYFICLCNHPIGSASFSCCTSQFDTVKRLVENKLYPPETLVYIPHSDSENPFTKDTYVNCNEHWVFSVNELWVKLQTGALQIMPNLLPLDSFHQVLMGLQASPVVEVELQESLPSMEDLDTPTPQKK